MEPTITLKLTQQQVAIIGKSLEAQPYGMVAPVINDIAKQIQAQQPTPPDAAG